MLVLLGVSQHGSLLSVSSIISHWIHSQDFEKMWTTYRKLGTRLIDGRGTKWDFQQKNQCVLTFLILHCSKLLRSSTSQPFFPHCFKSCFSSSKKAIGVIGPRLCLKTHWFTIALTSSDIRVCPATLEVAFTCCGHQSFFSERHALSIIWVPAREVPFFSFQQFCVWIVFFDGIQLQPQSLFLQPSIPKQHFHLDIPPLC